MTANEQPRILGIGGSLRDGSRTTTTMQVVLRGAAAAGAEVEALPLAELDLPLFRDGIEPSDLPAGGHRLLKSVRACDALVLATPVYHATPSGAMKNALDYLELMAGDDPPWLGGRLVGLVAVSGGGPGLHAIAGLDAACRALGGWTLPLTCAVAGNAFQDGKIAKDVGQRLLRLGRELARRALVVRAGEQAVTSSARR